MTALHLVKEPRRLDDVPQSLYTPIIQPIAKCFMTASVKDPLLLFTHDANTYRSLMVIEAMSKLSIL
jgi:hypothetical protein